MSRSTWACELKYFLGITEVDSLCHAPRERVSWNNSAGLYLCSRWCHAPRERVSWNKNKPWKQSNMVTSRSTWACELKYSLLNAKSNAITVTLHVSVWVEIGIPPPMILSRSSRSTWACELKLMFTIKMEVPYCHAPRERVSWNFGISWISWIFIVTLHVSVWVEISYTFYS